MALLGCTTLQHPSNRQRTFPFSSRCRFGARASLAGAGGGGQDPSELEAPGDGGGHGTSELEAPGHGGAGEADMVGDGGSDMAKCREPKESRGKPSFFLGSRRFFGPVNAASILQAHNRIGPCPAQTHEQMFSAEMPVSTVPEAQ